MAYNVDFLLSALAFLLIILRHFMEQRSLNTESSKAFLMFLLLGIANIVFDLLCTIFITLIIFLCWIRMIINFHQKNGLKKK